MIKTTEKVLHFYKSFGRDEDLILYINKIRCIGEKNAYIYNYIL